MKHPLLALLAAAALPLAAQSTAPAGDAVAQARKLITSGQAECVLVKNNRIIATERGGGVSPLLALYDARRADMAGATVVDKVIGRAAAAIALSGKAAHVHGELMSEDAARFLKENGVTASHTTLVYRILNRKLDGLCPLEQSVLGITDPADALRALRAKIASFQKKNG